MNCFTCEKELAFTWTDTHGVGSCISCGTPYTIFHYDKDKNRVESPPTVALDTSGISLAKRYWKEMSKRVFPGVYDMGILSGRSSTYSGATEDEMRNFNLWYVKQEENVTDGERE